MTAVLLAVLLALPLVSGSVPQATAEPPPLESSGNVSSIPNTGLSEEERIVHLLNRIGFGGRPGDVERVKRMGIATYIEEQLHPERIPDREMEERLAGFTTLTMTPRQLIAAYPPPQLLRGIERRLSARMGMDPEAEGTLFPELKQRRDRRRQQQGEQAPGQRSGRGAERMQRAMLGPGRIVMELSQAKLLRAVYSERQLQEVMTDFWFNHFNVFIGKGADRWLTTSYEYEAIRPHALGKFRDLLGATAAHPAMLFYLDNWMSADPNASYSQQELRRLYAVRLQEQGIQPGSLMLDVLRQRGVDTAQAERLIERQMAQLSGEPRMGRRGRFGRQRRRPPDEEQRKRGLNENYARELLELHTLGVDAGYTQEDVIEVARAFTGWTMLPLQFGAEPLYIDELHDRGAKVVLGHTLKNAGRQDGERVLDLLARHPATARFISTKLARRFVSDNPPASLVDRMAQTFTRTDGDIRSVLRTLFTSEEFWSQAAVDAKVKTPLEFVAGAARATGAQVDSYPPALVGALRELGQPLYAAQPPTGYKDTADVWVSTGGLLNRMKVALGLAANRMPGIRVDLPPDASATQSPAEIVNQLGEHLLGRPVSDNTSAAVLAELAKVGDEFPAGGLQAQRRLALGWLLASPEFQRR